MTIKTSQRQLMFLAAWKKISDDYPVSTCSIYDAVMQQLGRHLNDAEIDALSAFLTMNQRIKRFSSQNVTFFMPTSSMDVFDPPSWVKDLKS
jgi:hypothetical protein